MKRARSFSFALAAIVVRVVPVAAQISTAPTSVSSISKIDALPRNGEILLSGTISQFDATANVLTVEVVAFSLPNGRSKALKEAKFREVRWQTATIFIDSTGALLNTGEFSVGTPVYLVGPDGSEPFAPRLVRRVDLGDLRPYEPIPTTPLEPPDPQPQEFEPPSEIVPVSPRVPRRITPPPQTPTAPVFQSGLPRPPATALSTWDDLSPWLDQAGAFYPGLVTRVDIGTSAGGRPIVAFGIWPKNRPIGSMRRLAVVCRQHGDEPETSAAGAEFIYQLLAGQSSRAQRLRQSVAVLVIPVANPDGAAVKRRENALGQDLNRDWGRNRSREVAAITSLLRGFKPNLVLDVHQWVPGDATQTPMAEASGGGLSRTVASAMTAAARRGGYSLPSRSSGTGGALCHRFWGGQGIPAILLETIHRPGSIRSRNRAIGTSVTALQRALDILGG